jgi:hypothetical protein
MRRTSTKRGEEVLEKASTADEKAADEVAKVKITEQKLTVEKSNAANAVEAACGADVATTAKSEAGYAQDEATKARKEIITIAESHSSGSKL